MFQSTASSDLFCSFASCPRRTLELNVTDSPVILPCDNFTLINTSNNAVSGTYSYCLDGLLLSNQSTSYYTLEFDYSFNGKAICCYNHDRDTCGICYNLIVYCKYLYVGLLRVCSIIVTCCLLRCSKKPGYS